MSGISALVKETQRGPWLPLLCEVRMSKQLALRKQGPHQTRRIYQCLDLGVSSLWNCKKSVSVVYKLTS